MTTSTSSHISSSLPTLSSRSLIEWTFRQATDTTSSPEDVDTTDSGWATDYLVSLLAIVYMYTCYSKYYFKSKTTKHWMYMYSGTALAHLGLGLASSLYPNRASDGIGMIGFYVSSLVSYTGFCLRYGFGYGYGKAAFYLSLINFLWLLVSAIYCILRMETTTSRYDDGADEPGSVNERFLPDVVFGYAELFTAIMDMLFSMTYLCYRSHHTYAILFVLANLTAWVSTIVPGLWSYIDSNYEYDTRIIQIVFGYCMIVFLWAINELALVQSKIADEICIPKHTKKPATSLSGDYHNQYDDELPLGILLTGGRKLRKDGWDGTGIKIAVIDSGIDETHPGFHKKVIRKQWYRDGTPLSEDDHGTHVAGTIHLMAPGATILDYRVFGKSGQVSIDTAVAMSIRDAVDNDCVLINMSLGGAVASPEIKDAVDYAYSKGVTMVCAAGNEGDNDPLTNEISYPAYYDECISIAAVQKKDGVPVAVFSNSNDQVDYAGIGVDVTSFKPGGGYQQMSGTSMASPHACGLMACLIQKYGALPKDFRKKLMLSHVIDIGVEGIDNETGVGLLTYLTTREFDDLLRQYSGYSDAVVE